MAQTTIPLKETQKRASQFRWHRTDLFWLLGLLLLAAGAWGMWQRLSQGLLATSLNSYVPWGLWVAFYDYLVWLEVGSLLVFTTLLYLAGFKSLARLKPLVLFTGLVVLFMALLLVLMDLGRPGRFWHVYLYPDFRSMITWMVWLHTLYLVVLLAKLVLAFGYGGVAAERRESLLRALAYAGLPLGLALILVSGSVFGVVAARPLWNTSSLPLMFLASSLAAGSALLLLMALLFWPEKQSTEYRQLVGRLARLTAWLLLAGVFAAAIIGSTFLYQAGPVRADALRLMLTGPYWWSFWIVHLLLGVLVPLVILFTWSDRPILVGVAAALSVVTFAAVTLNIVIPVLATPELEGLVLAFVDARLRFNYLPNVVEWLLLTFVFGLGALLYGLGLRWLPVKPA
jgi:protein NrfD